MPRLDEITEIKLIRDVLDSQLVDRHCEPMGRVDGLILEVRRDQPPRLAFIEQGGPVPWRRLNRRLGDWAERIGTRRSVRGGKAYCIPWDKVREIGISVQVDVAAEETPALAWEAWVRDHIIRHIPGGH